VSGASTSSAKDLSQQLNQTNAMPNTQSSQYLGQQTSSSSSTKVPQSLSSTNNQWQKMGPAVLMEQMNGGSQ